MILDNRDNGRVVDALKEAIKEDAELNIITRRLSLFGYEALKDELDSVKALRLMLSQGDLFPEANMEKISPLLGELEDRPARNRLIAPYVAKQMDEWLGNKVNIKATSDPLNANYYEVKNSDGDQFAVNGSSTFTSTGLGVIPSSSHEMNNAYDDPGQIDSLNRWFKQIWENSDRNKDVKEDLSQKLKSIYKARSPEQLYFKTLLHLFSGSLDLVDEDEVIKTRTGIKDTLVWNKLYKFQRDGVIAAISKIEQYNGCIIADSVGLGKTFEALAVIKYYELRNDRVLVLAPKKLRENWTIYTLNDKRNLFAQDRFNFDVLNHTDLTRDGGMSGDINLETVNWGTYDLVVIDESHNFRNNPSKKEGVTRYGKLMSDIIKSGVKTKVLMLSATPVNNRMNDLKNQVAFITEAKDSALYDSGIHSIEQTLKKAQSKFNQWQNMDNDDRSSEKLLDMLGFDYFKLLDLLTIARSRKHITKYFDSDELGTFPERMKPINKKPDIALNNEFPPLREINREIRLLNLSAYAPLKYLLPDKREEYSNRYDTSLSQGVFRQVDREQSLIHLMRVNLLKRLESSVVSFTQTLEKLHGKVAGLIEKIDQMDEVEELSIEDIDLEDEELEPFLIGNKIKVLIQDMDLIRWKEELEEDQERLMKLLRIARSVDADNDAKLKELKDLLKAKAENPLNGENKKALIFTAFADTASYLYKNLKGWAAKELDVHSALVVGGTGKNKTTMPGLRADLTSIITSFSPVSKERDMIDDTETNEIDILIATDCISEGQNLQDCDLVVNYDIHWNPVRIIQRFGRVDRLGSKNERIQLVNFWPNLELDEYINLEARVSGRMVLLDISATGEENVIEYQGSNRMNDLEYRRKQMERLHEEVIDLEDLGSGISITDLTLNDFRMDLSEYLKDYEQDLIEMPIGCRAIVEPDEFVTNGEKSAGVLFCLQSDNPNISTDPNYSIEPYYLVYVDEGGQVKLTFTQTKKILDLFKQLSIGNKNVNQEALEHFETATKKGSKMEKYQQLLKESVQSIAGKSEEKGVESLFIRGGTNLSKTSFKGVNDFEIISYLVVSPNRIL
jgi:SNF2 family DNA or RNA helicase